MSFLSFLINHIIIGPGIKHNKKITILSTKVFIYSVFLKFETAIRIKEPDIKQHKIDMIKFDSENETSKQAIVNNKKVNLFRKSVKFTFFLPFL